MKDDSLLLPDGLLGEEHHGWAGTPELPLPGPSRKAAPPATCAEVLARLGPVKKEVYAWVRDSVDELEQAAPWELLYYPPEDPDALLAMIGGLVVTIRGVPDRVEYLLRAAPADGSGSAEPTQDEIGFLFRGIHRMVAHDLKRLDTNLGNVRDRGPAAPPTLAEGQLLCELAADLKGKYASSLMGAAANLIGEGLWDGVELEPVLFPEKAEEFRQTRELAVALRDAIAAIRQLPEQIPVVDILERWRQGRRVDQYALADLASLRGKIGRLLKERSRRALYSGDYHQISRRELLLSARINELERLHQLTWSPKGTVPDLEPVFAGLTQLLLEMAAVLDADLLKAMIGEKKVNGLRGRAATAAGKPRGATGTEAGLDALIPLLAEDDLRIFFEMLLAAVQRRASFSVRETAEPTPPAPAPPPAAPARATLAAPRAGTPPPRPGDPVPVAAPARPKVDPGVVLARIQAVLAELQAPTHPSWSSFRMTQRLLEKHSRIPLDMFRAVHPFLQEILARLIPELEKIAPYKGLTAATVAWLEGACHDLCERDPEPAEFAGDVPRKLERILRILDALRALAQSGG